MSLLSRACAPLRRLRKNSRGVAAVEFALVLPAMLFMYFGAAYTSTTVTLNKKMQTAAYDMVDMVPYPRNLCTYRTFVANSFSTGFQRKVMGEMLSPFEVSDRNPVVTYVEGAPDAQQLVPVVAKLRYTPESGPFRLFNSLTGGFSRTAVMRGGVITADSPVVTVKSSTACPATNNDTIKIYQNSVLVNDKTVSFEKMAGDSFNVAYTIDGGVPLLGTANPYRISSTNNLPPGVSFAANGTAPYYQGVVPENAPGAARDIYVANMTVSDYTSYLWSQPDKTAQTTVQFTVYHKLLLTVDTREQVVQMGAGQFFGPIPSASGGKPNYIFSVSNLPPGLTFDQSTGRVSGYATRPGQWQVTTTVRDQFGNVTVASPVLYTVKPVPLTIAGAPSFSAIGRQSVDYRYTADGGYGNISVKVCRDNNLGRIPNSFTCSLPVAVGHIDGRVFGQANELGSGRITIQVGDEAGQIATLSVSWNVSAPALFAYTEAPQAITAVYGQYVSLRFHTYGGWGYSRVAAVDNGCCGIGPAQIVDLGTANSEADHTFELRATINYITGPRTITVTFYDDAGSRAATSFTLNVPNQALNAWSDGNIVQTAGWCGLMPLFHSSGGNGNRVVAGYWGQPPGFAIWGDVNNFGFNGCSSPGSGTITWVVQDSIGQQASAQQYWQFNTPALVAWNDGSAIGTAGVHYNYPYFHSAGGWGARAALSITGNPAGPGGNGDANNWWLAGSAAPGSGYSTLVFGDSVGQRASSAQYWQMNYQPMNCWNDGSAINQAGNYYNFPPHHSNGGYGGRQVVSYSGQPAGMGFTGDSNNFWAYGSPSPGSGYITVIFRDATGNQCYSQQYWQMSAPPLSAWNDGSYQAPAGPYYDAPWFRSAGGWGYPGVVYLGGHPGWAGGRGDGRNYQIYGNSQPGSGVTTWVVQDGVGQQARSDQYWNFWRPPITFNGGGTYMTYYDGFGANWRSDFSFSGGVGSLRIVGSRFDTRGYPFIYPLNFGVGQSSGNTGFFQFSTSPYTPYYGTVVVQVCDDYGFCPVYQFDMTCNAHQCIVAAGPYTAY